MPVRGKSGPCCWDAARSSSVHWRNTFDARPYRRSVGDFRYVSDMKPRLTATHLPPDIHRAAREHKINQDLESAKRVSRPKRQPTSAVAVSA